MATERKVNWNTILLTVNLGLVGYFGRKADVKLDETHDAVVNHSVQITELRTRVVALEIDWQKWKEKHP